VSAGALQLLRFLESSFVIKLTLFFSSMVKIERNKEISKSKFLWMMVLENDMYRFN
jgi:hypothetical protein